MSSSANIQALVSNLSQKSKHLKEELTSRDEIISKVLSKVGLNDDTPRSTNSVSPNQAKSWVSGSSRANKGKASTSQGLGASTSTPCRTNQLPSSRLASGQQKTPTRQLKTPPGQQKRAGTPKTASPTANPLQMMTRNMPKSFSSTRDALYVHIEIIWNLLELKEIPGLPHPITLTKFNSQFSDADQIARSSKNVEGTPLIPVTDIVTLKSLWLARQKIGKGIVNLEDFFVDYTQATLACLGLSIWGPDLDDSPQSLYNKACRQAALKYFWQAAAGGAYAYMNISKKYKKDLELLIPKYNHYVHFLQKKCYKREEKQVGKFCEDKEHKVIGRERDRLRDTRLKFALAQKLPKQYQKIISNVSAHSNNECNSKKGLYIIKTLKFRSENTTKFFCRLDADMLVSDELEQKHVQRRKREPAVPPKPLLFPKPPKGLPLDFYDPAWFNNLLTQKRIDVANTRAVAFLPDASKSLQGKKLPAEKLLDKQFTKHYFDKLLEPYDLTHEIENEEEEDTSDTENDSSYFGEEINFNDTSGDSEPDDNNYENLENPDDAMECADKDIEYN
ncbi:hypothetical protein VP01_2722g5 [Puccinia sorghi]|uniref:Uncharacterized protein n=1 Tax=Puccinia sorghi TaxID=27349 RepID=A0A0L6V3B8_9BASI|nr:hypothetical protein VP01_2722g5 [Puccinia sorghi]